MADPSLRAQGQEALRLLRSHQPVAAMIICRRILSGFPKHMATYDILGQIYMQTSRYEEAADLFQRVLGADPENLSAYTHLALIYEHWGRAEEAIWHWERALEISPGDQDVRSHLQDAYAQRDPQITTVPRLTQAALARIHLRGQMLTQAVRELSQLVLADPRRFDLRVALIEALWRTGQHDAASVASESILQELPFCLKANLILGQIWLHTAQDQQARTFLQRAQELDPENLVAQSLFGHKSPLPPRLLRLPYDESEAAPVELPYLVDDEDVVTQSMIIDAQVIGTGPGVVGAEEMAPSSVAPEHPLPEVALGSEADVPPERAEPSVVDEAVEERGSTYSAEPSQQPVLTGDEYGTTPPEKMSLLDIQHQYLLDHPEDFQARLDLARRLRDMGHLTEALDHYRILVHDSYDMVPAVVRDLELLSRLYPNTPAIGDALQSAQERERHTPPQE